MLLVCGRWTSPGTAVHGDFCLRRLLRVDGVHRLFLKHWPITCGFVCRQQANTTIVNNNNLRSHIQAENIKLLQLRNSLVDLDRFHQKRDSTVHVEEKKQT